MTMCVENTPLENYPEFAMWAKREDLCCPGGPNFSKTRGVYAHIAARPEQYIGVLDTTHSQGGWAVARACKLLRKQCILFYPVRKSDSGPMKSQQLEAQRLGALLRPMAATASWALYHKARKALREIFPDSYMMPNALKLPESVEETRAEFARTAMPNDVDCVLISASSGTIAAGVVKGLIYDLPVIVHLGYSRSEAAVRQYIAKISGVEYSNLIVVDEKYTYADEARPGPDAPFPSNEFYDLKAFRWWVSEGGRIFGKALFWNIG